MKESERLKRKHLLKICGEPMLSRIYRALSETGLFASVTVFSKYPSLVLEGMEIDDDDTRGLLIDSIVRAVELYGEFLAVAGDLPFIDHEVISWLIGRYNGRPIAAIDVEGTIEPLFAIYNTSVLEDLRQFSVQNRNIFPFIAEKFDLMELDAEGSRKLLNVNTEEDYEEVLRRIDCSKDYA